MPASRKPGPSVKDDEMYEALRDEGSSRGRSSTDKSQPVDALRRH